MATVSSAPKDDPMVRAIHDGLKKQIEQASHEIIERHRQQMIEELDIVRSEAVAAVALRVAKVVQVQYAQDRLIISVEYKELEHAKQSSQK